MMMMAMIIGILCHRFFVFDFFGSGDEEESQCQLKGANG